MQTTIDVNDPVRRQARRDYVYGPLILVMNIVMTLVIILTMRMDFNMYTNRNGHPYPGVYGPLSLVSAAASLAALWYFWVRMPRNRKAKFDHFYSAAEYTRTTVANIEIVARWGCNRAGNPRPDPLSLSHDQLVELVALERHSQRSRNDLLARHVREERDREQAIRAQVRNVFK